MVFKAIITTGDDFGVSREVNAGILRAHREGVLRATSLMVAGAAHLEAAAIARGNPGLDVGLHVVVCRGKSVLPPARLGGVADATGSFLENPVMAGMRYFFDRRVRSLIRDELRAQVETHLKLVGYLNHIDGHLNFHVHPVLADILIDLAAEYRVPCMRLPREPVLTTLSLARDRASRKMIEAVIFKSLSRRTRRLMAARGIRTSDRLFGLHQSGHLSEAYVLGVIKRLKPGITELYFHPGDGIGADRPEGGPRREVEILTGSKIRETLANAQVTLMNFADLAREPIPAK